MLELFKPHELMAVVIGNEDYDWYALEAEAEYKNGYTSGDQTVLPSLLFFGKMGLNLRILYRYDGFGKYSTSSLWLRRKSFCFT